MLGVNTQLFKYYPYLYSVIKKTNQLEVGATL